MKEKYTSVIKWFMIMSRHFKDLIVHFSISLFLSKLMLLDSYEHLVTVYQSKFLLKNLHLIPNGT